MLDVINRSIKTKDRRHFTQPIQISNYQSKAETANQVIDLQTKTVNP